jgi:hypothetical protein
MNPTNLKKGVTLYGGPVAFETPLTTAERIAQVDAIRAEIAALDRTMVEMREQLVVQQADEIFAHIIASAGRKR